MGEHKLQLGHGDLSVDTAHFTDCAMKPVRDCMIERLLSICQGAYFNSACPE